MESPTVGIKEGNYVQDRHLSVEGVRVVEVVVPNLLHGIAKELGSAMLGHLVTGVVIKVGFVRRFCMDADNSDGIVRDGAIIEKQTYGANECVAPMIGSVTYHICEDGCERADPSKLIVGYLHEDGEKHFPD